MYLGNSLQILNLNSKNTAILGRGSLTIHYLLGVYILDEVPLEVFNKPRMYDLFTFPFGEF